MMSLILLGKREKFARGLVVGSASKLELWQSGAVAGLLKKFRRP